MVSTPPARNGYWQTGFAAAKLRRHRQGLRILAARSNHSAAAMVSGVVLQFERALFHLAAAGAGKSVAVECVDDVSRHREGKTVAQEQDKHTITRSNAVLGDRSTDLWRTLQIWVQGIRDTDQPSTRYLLVTNASPKGAIVDAMRRPAHDAERSAAIISALRAAGRLRKSSSADSTPSKIQIIIDDVLSASEPLLLDLVDRIELVEHYDSAAQRPNIAARLGVHPDVDSDIILDAVMGWIVDRLKSAWQSKVAGIIAKDECLRYVRETEARQIRRRWIPRPPREIPVQEHEVESARGRAFVDQIVRIDLEEDEILQAIEHWVQFNAERHRLALTGDIPAEEWEDRAERLRQRWRFIDRQAARSHKDATPVDRGYHVYSQTTYHHHEDLGGNPCRELYMTTGHYHRLADDAQVRWHPEYTAD